MRRTVLCVNSGSSSIKFQLFDVTPRDELQLVLRGQLDGIGSRPHLVAKSSTGVQLVDQSYTAQEMPDVPAAPPKLTEWLRTQLIW